MTYRQIPVGKVVDLALGEQADRVLISILIEPRYVPLVRSDRPLNRLASTPKPLAFQKRLPVRTSGT
ncbi:hypothetical protein ACV34S_33755 [Pseudomonas aeruginosa]